MFTVDKIIELWCDALESDKYTQGTGLLCRFDGNGNKSYCCLGVLTDLYQNIVGGLIEEKIYCGNCEGIRYSDNVGEKATLVCFESCNVLPDNVKEWAHLQDNGGRYGGFNECLWQDNDTHHKTFPEIAAIIKEKRDTLFRS